MPVYDRWGKKLNEDVPYSEKRRAVLQTVRAEQDLKEHNRRSAWAILRGRRKPMSKPQIAAGARKLI
jgi:hypothetical protein